MIFHMEENITQAELLRDIVAANLSTIFLMLLLLQVTSSVIDQTIRAFFTKFIFKNGHHKAVKPKADSCCESSRVKVNTKAKK